MIEYRDRNTLLASMQSGYQEFTTFIDALSTEQLLAAGVNSTWSIKDNLAHLSAWQKRTLDRISALVAGIAFADPTPGMTEDDLNELFYQQNKDRSLADIRAAFQQIQQQLVDLVETLDNEALNRPFYPNADFTLWQNIAGNTYEHYQEHTQIIQRWLAQNG